MKKILPLAVITAMVFAGCGGNRKVGSSTPPPVVVKPVEPVKPAAEPVKEVPKIEPVVLVNTLTSAEIAAGWKLLFDGISSDGWHAYGSKTIGNAWKQVDGTLHLDASDKKDWQTKSGGDIVTDKEYGNFELQLEWKISKGGNSGICFYVVENYPKLEYMWYTGPEMQILDNDLHADAKIHKHRAGDLYDLIPSKSEPVKKPMEWNQVKIRSVNGKLDMYLNGVNVVSTTLWDDNWKNIIANSKFKNIPGFGMQRRGKIGLQDHGDNVWFRNIKIKEL